MSYGTVETLFAAEELVLSEIAHRGVGVAEGVHLGEEVCEAGRICLTNLLERDLAKSCGRECLARILDGGVGIDRPSGLREPSDEFNPADSPRKALSDEDGGIGAENPADLLGGGSQVWDMVNDKREPSGVRRFIWKRYGARISLKHLDARRPQDLIPHRGRRLDGAKIELGLWQPGEATATDTDQQPTFAELATEWLEDRERNPAIRSRTTEDDRWRLIRYLIPHFGEMLPSQITPLSIKQYRRGIHRENEHIRAAQRAGTALKDSRTGQPLRPLSNDSINKTLRTLALILDEAEDAGWVVRNVARGRRTREPVERQRRDALEPDELLSLLDAASQLDFAPHKPRTLERADEVRTLRDGAGLEWKEIATRLGVAPSTAAYLYSCEPREAKEVGPRRAVIATLALTGLRVSELCALGRRDVDLARARISVRDAKTDAGVRTVDIRPRLLTELTAYREAHPDAAMDAPAFPTAAGTRRDRNNVSGRVITPTVNRANELRSQRDQPPIMITVTPHTFRRTYITFMLAAGFDVPYVQDQVGHTDPITTLGIYARVIRRADRDKLREELRELFGEQAPTVPDLTPRVVEMQAHWRGLERSEREGLER